jgi:hypothetical protein
MKNDFSEFLLVFFSGSSVLIATVTSVAGRSDVLLALKTPAYNFLKSLFMDIKKVLFTAVMVCLVGCAHDTRHRIIISTADQKMLLLEDGKPVALYRVSTSKYGVGDAFGSYATPTGHLIVSQKIGEGMPCGMVFKDRKPTGEVLYPNAPGRDPIVTRIIWLKGTEAQNRNAYARYIYIHGTPEEKNLGHPKSYGCIRMSSADVVQLYERVGKGTKVEIVEEKLSD